ncbi:NAD-dependent epimerase/dehydratase family protein [Patescibacteria group bacterium]|nr:NAD-dependent epimerase/dehydratase family protein [Patescibacteria group bacterium]
MSAIFDKKNVIVTGGVGFIGSHLCEKLLAEGARVICIDNLISSSLNNIDFLLKNPDFEFIRHDINTPFNPEQYPELERFKISFQGVQEIYNLACPMSPKGFEQTRMQTLYANSIGIKNMLDVAVKYKAKFLHTSSSTIYGPRPSDNHKLKESELGAVDVHGARAMYDEGKRFSETACMTYQSVHGVNTKIARIFRTYGPRERLFSGEMVPDFIVNALDGKDIEIYGDETFTTSLCYVTDVVDGLLKLMANDSDIGPVNIGSDIDMPLVEVVRHILEMTQSQSRIVFQPSLLFMTPLGLPDLSSAKEKLGWMPLVPLDEGLKKIIDYTMAYKNLMTDFGKTAAPTAPSPDQPMS